jgi:rod shape-determining protein MreD
VRHRFIFGLVTLLIIWVIQVMMISLIPVGWPTPHILLLVLLALGGRGEVDLAQSLGFFGGLALDVMGVSLFGSQGLVLCLIGFSVGRLARQLNVDKVMTQMAVTGFTTLFFWTVLALLDHLFRPAAPERPLFPDIMALGLVYNVLLAPVGFRLINWWWDFWMDIEGSAFFRSGRKRVG